jgi:hypothetical protein
VDKVIKPFALSLSKGVLWFDRLITNGLGHINSDTLVAPRFDFLDPAHSEGRVVGWYNARHSFLAFWAKLLP